jgi:uncharacterized membrane protein YfcA
VVDSASAVGHGAPIAGTAFLIAAGFLAGVVGTAGGITSLISYPALLAVGLDPFAANLTNAVALIGTGLASSLVSRPELLGHRTRLRAWALLAAAGGISGATLLLVTPPGAFVWIVPFLVAFASVLLLAQPRISGRRAVREEPRGGVSAGVAIVGVSVYSGYFGAGAGVLIIAILLLLVDADLARANALKNALLACADIIPGVMFAVAGPVSWSAAIPLAIGASLGGLLGPGVTRRVPHRILRIVVASMGFGLSAWLIATAIQ